MRLNELAPNEGAKKNRKRLGRGIGSGTGKTSGKGHKGQKARSGTATRTFEGGQMPIYRRLPKRGFTNIHRKDYAWLNLDNLQQAIEHGRLDAGQPIDEQGLLQAGLVRRVLDGVRLLGRGEIKQAVTLKITGASKSAVSAIEAAGGSVEILGGKPEHEAQAEA